MKLKMTTINNFSIIGVWVMIISLTGCSSDNRNRQSLAGEPGTEAKEILLVCHRGANRLAPENTYASAKKAIEFNAGNQITIPDIKQGNGRDQ